jgi:hypothetical protein
MINGGLFKESVDHNVFQGEADKLFKTWVFEEHIHTSSSICAWRRTLHKGYNAIREIVLGKNNVWPTYPSISTLHLRLLIKEKELSALKDVRCQLVDALVMSKATGRGSTQVDLDKLKQGVPQLWQPVLIPQDGQSSDSQLEQGLCLKALTNAIKEKVNQQASFVKGSLLIGKPGAVHITLHELRLTNLTTLHE